MLLLLLALFDRTAEGLQHYMEVASPESPLITATKHTKPFQKMGPFQKGLHRLKG